MPNSSGRSYDDDQLIYQPDDLESTSTVTEILQHVQTISRNSEKQTDHLNHLIHETQSERIQKATQTLEAQQAARKNLTHTNSTPPIINTTVPSKTAINKNSPLSPDAGSPSSKRGTTNETTSLLTSINTNTKNLVHQGKTHAHNMSNLETWLNEHGLTGMSTIHSLLKKHSEHFQHLQQLIPHRTKKTNDDADTTDTVVLPKQTTKNTVKTAETTTEKTTTPHTIKREEKATAKEQSEETRATQLKEFHSMENKLADDLKIRKNSMREARKTYGRHSTEYQMLKNDYQTARNHHLKTVEARAQELHTTSTLKQLTHNHSLHNIHFDDDSLLGKLFNPLLADSNPEEIITSMILGGISDGIRLHREYTNMNRNLGTNLGDDLMIQGGNLLADAEQKIGLTTYNGKNLDTWRSEARELNMQYGTTGWDTWMSSMKHLSNMGLSNDTNLKNYAMEMSTMGKSASQVSQTFTQLSTISKQMGVSFKNLSDTAASLSTTALKGTGNSTGVISGTANLEKYMNSIGMKTDASTMSKLFSNQMFESMELKELTEKGYGSEAAAAEATNPTLLASLAASKGVLTGSLKNLLHIAQTAGNNTSAGVYGFDMDASFLGLNPLDVSKSSSTKMMNANTNVTVTVKTDKNLSADVYKNNQMMKALHGDTDAYYTVNNQ